MDAEPSFWPRLTVQKTDNPHEAPPHKRLNLFWGRTC